MGTIYDAKVRTHSSPTENMNTVEIFKRLKIGLSLLVGLGLGKLAAAWDEEHYSLLFSIAFLIGAIGTQGVFRLLDLWRQKPSRSPK